MEAAHEIAIPQRGKLLKILGVGFGLAICIGATVGVGILRSPGLIAQYLGSPGLIMFAWALGAVYAILGANVLAELGTSTPKSGGMYVFAHRALGDYWGFVAGVCDWFQTAVALAFLAVVFGEYAASLFAPNVAGARPAFSVAVLVMLAALNWKGVREGSTMQKMTSFLKALALVAFVVACFMYGGQTSSENVAHPVVQSASSGAFASVVAFILAFQLVLGTYEGWQGPVYFSEENVDPARSIPQSLFGGILLITAIYLLVNLALIYVLPMTQLAGSKFAGADAMSLIYGERSGQILTVLALLSILGILNAYLMANPRISLALARDGLFPQQAKAINAGGTPYIGLLFTTIFAAVFAALGSFELLLAIAQFFSVSISIIVIVSFFRLRRREPETPRPFKAWGYPLLPGIVLICSASVFVGYAVGNPFPSAIALAVILLTYPTYRLIKRRISALR